MHSVSITNAPLTTPATFIARLSMFKQKHQGKRQAPRQRPGARRRGGLPSGSSQGAGVAEPSPPPTSHHSLYWGTVQARCKGEAPQKSGNHNAHCIRKWISIWTQKRLVVLQDHCVSYFPSSSLGQPFSFLLPFLI